MHSDILLYIVVVPIIGGFFSAAMPDKFKNLTKFLALSITGLTLGASIYLFVNKPVYWQLSSSTMFAVDNLSGFIGIGIAFFSLLITIYSLGFIDGSFGRYFGYMLMTLGASLGVAYANDFVWLVVFWGFLAITLYLLVNLKGTDGARRAAKKALIIIGSTDGLMVFGIALVWALAGTFSMDKIRIPLSQGAIPILAYLSIASASFAKAGVIPLHSWMPDVSERAPTPVAAYLPASLDKLLGIYLLARISLNSFVMNGVSNLILLWIGSITIIYAVLMALVQHDFKKLLGYHAVSQVGYMVLGIGLANPIGIAGGLFHMLNNAVYKSCLFLTGGAVEKRLETTDLDRLGGLARYMPITFVSCLVASLAISGVPPFNGFVSKWMIYQGIIETARSGSSRLWVVWLLSAMFGSALTLASFMKLLHTAFLGRPSKDFGYVKEVGPALTLPMIILASTCIIFGVFAFGVPLSLFIIPSVGNAISYLGIWSPGIATLMIIIGIALGLVIYLFSKSAPSRSVEAFVGGEDASTLERVSGTEFYDTIKETKILKPLYIREESGGLDIYEGGRRLISSLTTRLQYLHNGILPTYMIWCLIGMIVMFLLLLFKR